MRLVVCNTSERVEELAAALPDDLVVLEGAPVPPTLFTEVIDTTRSYAIAKWWKQVLHVGPGGVAQAGKTTTP